MKVLLAIGSRDIVLGDVNRPIEAHIRLGGAGPLPFHDNTLQVQALVERDMQARNRRPLPRNSGDRFRPRLPVGHFHTDRNY